MSGPSSAQIPDASNSFRIHCFKSYSVNGFFSRTHFAACPNAPPMMRSIITPAEKWDSFCSRLQHASYFCTRSAELTTLAPAPRTSSTVPASTIATGDPVLRRVLHRHFFRAAQDLLQIFVQFVLRG